MTLREEILKNSGAIVEMSIKRTEPIKETIDTPIGTFYIRNDEEDFDINEYGDFDYICSYIKEADIFNWIPRLEPEFVISTIIVGFGRDRRGQYAKIFFGKKAAEILDILAEKMPNGMFNKGIEECEKTLKAWKEKKTYSSSYTIRKQLEIFGGVLKRFKNKYNNSTREY